MLGACESILLVTRIAQEAEGRLTRAARSGLIRQGKWLDRSGQGGKSSRSPASTLRLRVGRRTNSEAPPVRCERRRQHLLDQRSVRTT